ncbi:MAG: hypothetical protein SNJ84_08475, partial [Verrucomicrobiia bacterium]
MRRHALGHFRRRTQPGPSPQPRTPLLPQSHRPHPTHPRHLRPTRQNAGGQTPNRTGPTPIPRQSGGIGTRGPGETQLEVDRRRV